MRPLLLPALALAALAVAPASAADGPVVVSDASVAPAGCADRTQASTADLAVRGRQVLASWHIGQDAAVGVALSQDGGRRFSRSVTDLTSCSGGPVDYVLDPDVAIGADGAPWVAVSGPVTLPAQPTVTTGDADSRVYVKVGTAAPVSVVSGEAGERSFLETDPVDPRSALVLSELLVRGTVSAGPVVYGTAVPGVASALVVSSTRDRGRTWTPTTLRTALPGHALIALGLVRTSGALVALGVDVDLAEAGTLAAIDDGVVPPGTIASQRSVDGGATWSEPLVLGHPGRATLGDAAAGGGTAAFAAVQGDGSVLVWTTCDGGLSWRQTTAATNAYGPATAVAVDDRGRVGVLSYRQTGDLLTPQVSTSRDGRAFSAPVRLDAPFSLQANPGAGEVPPLGPWSGGASDGKDLLFAYVQGVGGRTEVRLARVS